ncbi:hypothetical protein DVH24_016316 [Malus domestica]|uniref:Disease resistance R13L4/SHOC-2-like LRR domain-containing protein n=1 Tax=Malus domestica TaxID=3750 RepID=A0A498HTA7_MALDO|nr:hypothetical protein DVH24_016316 [Malus domestica]
MKMILPDSIHDLYNLYTLRLKRCYALRKLPDNMGKLINLTHLYVEGCAALAYLPKGLGRLTSLQTLDAFSGDHEKAFQFADLRTLNLEGRLTVTFPGDVEDVSEVEKAQLWDKKQLFHLSLISRVEDNMQRENTAVDILRPHEDLESLDECELLSPLGKLPSLERLTLRWMERVRRVGVEFLGYKIKHHSIHPPHCCRN